MEVHKRCSRLLLIFLSSFLSKVELARVVNVIVPAYFDPDTNPQVWNSLNAGADLLPYRVVAIANVDSGPGTAKRQDYYNVITSLQNNTGRAIGYVHTTYGNKSVAQVQAEVDQWYSFYPTIDGIFFDEVANTDGKQAYYQTLYKYVKAKNVSSLVVNNPGTSTLESYLFYNGTRVTDVICVFESGVGALQWSQQAWTSKYDRSNFYGLFYNVTDVNASSINYRSVINHAYGQNVGWLYVTNDSLPNPWDTIASYWLNEIKYILNHNYLLRRAAWDS